MKVVLVLLILHIIFCSVLSDSICDEVDSVFIFDTSVIMNDAVNKGDKIKGFIDNVIYRASSEKSGVGFIVFGDLPITLESNSMDDITFLGLSETKLHSTSQTQNILRSNLVFDDFFNNENMPNYASFELALKAAHNLFIKESVIENDAIFIFDTDHSVKQKCINYFGIDNDDNNDIENVYFVEIEFNEEGDIELDHVFDCKNNGDESEKYDALNELFELTCPHRIDLNDEYFAKLNIHDQWIDPESVISCNIEMITDEHTNKPIIVDGSVMIVDDNKNDLMSFEKDYILLTKQEDMDIMTEKGCYLPVIKITRITDKKNGIFELNIDGVSPYEYISEGHIRYHGDHDTSSKYNIKQRRRMVDISSPKINFDEEFDVTASISRGDWELSGIGTLGVIGYVQLGLSFDIDFDLDIDWCWFIPCGIDYFIFAVTAGIDVSFQLNTSFTGSLQVTHNTFELQGASISFWVFVIPVWYAPRLEISEVLTLTASYTMIQHHFAIEFHPKRRFGVEYDGSSWNAIDEDKQVKDNHFGNEFGFGNTDKQYDGCASGELTFGVEIKLGVVLYSTVYVYLSATPALKAELYLPSYCGGNDACNDQLVPNYIEINPSLVLSLGVGFEILCNFVTKLISACGYSFDVPILDELTLLTFPQICIDNEINIPLTGCCANILTSTSAAAGTIRLGGDGSTDFEGRVEISNGYHWTTVCNDAIDDNVGTVLCRQIGGLDDGFTLYKTNGVTPYGEGIGYIGFDNVNCNGREDKLYDCQYTTNHNCGHDEDLSIKCLKPSTGDIRLTGIGSITQLMQDVLDSFGGSSSLILALVIAMSTSDESLSEILFQYNDELAEYGGRVEIYDGNNWGTVCNDNIYITNNIGNVICRQLGYYSDAYSLYNTQLTEDNLDALGMGTVANHVRDIFKAGTGPTIMNNVSCDGTELKLIDCDYSSETWSHSEDLWIQCVAQKPGSIRLVGSGSTHSQGRVEVNNGAKWGAICNECTHQECNGAFHIDNDDIGQVICRHLGFDTSGFTIFDGGNSPYGTGSGEISMFLYNCDGTENNVFNCEYFANPTVDGMGMELCSHSEEISIKCIPSQGDIVLTGTDSTDFEGRIEIYIGTEWGTICNDGSDLNVGKVICKQLGYSTKGIIFYATDNNTPYGEGTGSILMSNINCIGTETKLIDCQYTSYPDISCSHNQDISIKCSIPIKGDIRLSDGESEYQGIVEIFDGNNWGTICNDNIDTDNNIGIIICNEIIGSNYGFSLNKRINIYPDTSSDELSIFMDNINCQGTETNLFDCQYNTDISNLCNHDQDLSIKCELTQYGGSSIYHGTSTWDDISIGDKVLIKFRNGGYLRDDGDSTLSTYPVFKKKAMIWTVKYIGDFSGYFQFENVATGLYLKNDGTNCISTSIGENGEDASWTQYEQQNTESFNHHRIYHSFINKGKNECCEVSKLSDTSIISSSCSSETYATFEILDDHETQTTIRNGEYSGTSLWSDISEGDKVLIKFRSGGYLKDNGDNTVKTKPNFNSDAMIWEVRDDYSSGHLQFRNVATGKYLKSTTTKCITEPITGSGDAGSWIENGRVGTETFEGHRMYISIKNKKHATCCQAGNTWDDSIVSSDCNSNGAYLTLEILDNVLSGSSSPRYLDTLSRSNILLILAICIIINVFLCSINITKMCTSKNKRYQKVVSIETSDDETI